MDEKLKKSIHRQKLRDGWEKTWRHIISDVNQKNDDHAFIGDKFKGYLYCIQAWQTNDSVLNSEKKIKLGHFPLFFKLANPSVTQTSA